MIHLSAEESHSGYCNSLENCNPSRGSWVRVPPPPPRQFTIGATRLLYKIAKQKHSLLKCFLLVIRPMLAPCLCIKFLILDCRAVLASPSATLLLVSIWHNF